MLQFKLKVFIGNIKRLIKWIPIIWKDRDYEYESLYSILEFKIKIM